MNDFYEISNLFSEIVVNKITFIIPVQVWIVFFDSFIKTDSKLRTIFAQFFGIESYRMAKL